MMSTCADFLVACLATCTAEVFTLPADTLKVRMQLWGRDQTLLAAIARIYKENGVLAFFVGLDTAILRQATYGTLKYGLYPIIVDYMRSAYPLCGEFSIKLTSGLLAGSISSGLCNPADLLKTRKQGNSMKGKTISEGFATIVRNEGIASLWLTGLLPNILRASVLAAAELVTYDLCRPIIATYTSSETLRPILSAFLASMCATVASSPFDTIKSRMMNQLKEQKDKPQKYHSTFHCLRKSITDEGILVLWSGLLAYFLRLVPNTILTLFFLEKFRALLSRLI